MQEMTMDEVNEANGGLIVIFLIGALTQCDFAGYVAEGNYWYGA